METNLHVKGFYNYWALIAFALKNNPLKEKKWKH